MSTSTATVPRSPVDVLPAQRAAANVAANRAALARTQPWLLETLPPAPAGLEWLLGRDGSLTAFTADGQWWAGCSLPWRAARSMFRSLKLESLMGCFLSPGWAAQVRLCLDLIEPRQAVLAVVPAKVDAAMMLHCEEFAEDISAGRLWFAAGEDWVGELEAIFDRQPGLVVPTQFIRAMGQSQNTIDSMVAAAQKVFADVNSHRGAVIEEMRKSHAASDRLCVVCPSQFALWNDAGPALAEAMEQMPADAGVVSRLDSDCPISASAMALATAVRGCGAMVIPDAGRGDLPGVIADEVAWITWVTRGVIPTFSSAGPMDRLLLADRSWQREAIAGGWPEGRVAIAEWPMVPTSLAAPAQPAHLAMLVDTLPATAPASVTDFSSQGILWEHIRRELLADPFAVGDDVELFLNRLVRELEIAPESLDRRIFLNELVIPTYQHGLALHLVRNGIPLKLFGKGWDAVSSHPDCAVLQSAWVGPVRSGQQMRAVAAAATALVHSLPSRFAHPIHRYGRAVIGPSLSANAFAREATRLLRGAARPSEPRSPICLSGLLRKGKG